jgi:hypothetical protein
MDAVEVLDPGTATVVLLLIVAAAIAGLSIGERALRQIVRALRERRYRAEMRERAEWYLRWTR